MTRRSRTLPASRRGDRGAATEAPPGQSVPRMSAPSPASRDLIPSSSTISVPARDDGPGDVSAGQGSVQEIDQGPVGALPIVPPRSRRKSCLE